MPDFNFDWSSLPGYGTDPTSGNWSNVDVKGMSTTIPGIKSFLDPSEYLNNPQPGLKTSLSPGDYLTQAFSQKGGQQPGGGANPLADLASMAGAFSSGEKANRDLQGNFTQAYDRNMLAAQQARNTNESDALKKLAQTGYITGGGSTFKAPTSMMLNGKSIAIPDLGYGPKPSTDAQKAGAGALQSQLQARLSPGGSYTPQPLDSYAKPGLAEKIGSYTGAGLSGLGSVINAFGGGGGSNGEGSSPLSSITNGIKQGTSLASTGAGIAKMLGFGSGASSAAPAFDEAGNFIGSSTVNGANSLLGTVGKLAGPIAGGALGTYGLVKNASTGSDIMSGAGAGASIGSLGGPIGMGVGAGVGALVGALRGLFSVTGKEQGGRDAQDNAVNTLTKITTPEQQAEAAKAGWADPKQALALITVRDQLIKSGMPPQQAITQSNAMLKGLYNNEKSGSDSVAKAYSPIQALMQGQGGGSTPQAPGSLVTDAFSAGARR